MDNKRSRAVTAAAGLAVGQPISSLYIVCEGQKSVASGRLESLLDAAGDKMKAYVAPIRDLIDDHSRLQADNAKLKDDLEASRAAIDLLIANNGELKAFKNQIESIVSPKHGFALYWMHGDALRDIKSALEPSKPQGVESE